MKVRNVTPNGSAGLVSVSASTNGLVGIPIDFTTPPVDGETVVYDAATDTFVPGAPAGPVTPSWARPFLIMGG